MSHMRYERGLSGPQSLRSVSDHLDMTSTKRRRSSQFGTATAIVLRSCPLSPGRQIYLELPKNGRKYMVELMSVLLSHGARAIARFIISVMLPRRYRGPGRESTAVLNEALAAGDIDPLRGEFLR